MHWTPSGNFTAFCKTPPLFLFFISLHVLRFCKHFESRYDIFHASETVGIFNKLLACAFDCNRRSKCF